VTVTRKTGVCDPEKTLARLGLVLGRDMPEENKGWTLFL